MFTRLLLSLALAAAFGVSAATPERPLTTTEAANLGLDPNDATLTRIGEPSHGDVDPSPDQALGGTQFASYSAFRLRGATNEAYLDETAGGRWCFGGSTNPFGDMALVDLPHGATVQLMRVWGHDVDTNDDLTVSLIRRCFPTETDGNPITTVIAELTPQITAGNFSLSASIPGGLLVDNNSCSYTVRTRFSTPGSPEFCAGSNLRLQKVRFQIVPP